MKIITTVIAATAFLFPLVAQADHHGAKPTKNVVEIAASAKDFSTLVAAVKAAGLVATLKGKGPLPSSRQTMLLSQNYRRELWKHC